MKTPISSPQAGSSYVLVLVLVSVLSAFALTFVTQTGMRVAAGADRTEDAQAAYLAEAAVHHATWRLFHEPGFPADETVYAMHDFGAGRYGYKVRAPTPTTLATIATVGVVEESVVRQSWAQYVRSRIMTAYGTSESKWPPCRRLVGATWSSPASTVDLDNNELTWVELAGSPDDDEILMATIDGSDAVRLAVWDGESWGSELLLAVGKKEYKVADVAYESASGDGLVAAWSGAPGELRYTVWNGTAWSAPASVNTTESSDIRFVRMAAHPTTDEILLVAVHANEDIRLLRWNGNAFVVLAQLESDAAVAAPFVADVVYERISGRALIVWGRDLQGRCGYAVWNGIALLTGFTLPDFGSETRLVRAAADPASNFIVIAAEDAGWDLHVAAWDGTAWVDSAQLENVVDQASAFDRPNFDVAWESTGGEAVIAWARNSQIKVRFVHWPRDSTFASRSTQIGPNFGAELRAMRLFPVDGTQNVVMLASNNSAELCYCLWVGNEFVADPAQVLGTSLSTTSQLPFAVARAAS